MTKLVIKENGKIKVDVINENNKIINTFTFGRKNRNEILKEIIAKYDVATINYSWKSKGVGGAGLWYTGIDVKADTFEF